MNSAHRAGDTRVLASGGGSEKEKGSTKLSWTLFEAPVDVGPRHSCMGPSVPTEYAFIPRGFHEEGLFQKEETKPANGLVSLQEALRQVEGWQKELDSGGVTKADIARREGYSRALRDGLEQIAHIVPSDVKTLLEEFRWGSRVSVNKDESWTKDRNPQTSSIIFRSTRTKQSSNCHLTNG